ncbi:MAG: diacylglycerol kinase [Comamonas sp.]
MSTPNPVNPQKSRTGLSRVLHAGKYSLNGLHAGWNEKAFQQESICAMVMVPAAFWLGQSWEQVALLAGTVVLVLIVELLNSGIEAAIDRIGPEWHDLSKKAKDMGSAAVFLSLWLCGAVWAAAIYYRFIA